MNALVYNLHWHTPGPELNFRSRILKFRLRLQKPRSFGRLYSHKFSSFSCSFSLWFFQELSFFRFLYSFYCKKSCQKWRKNIVEENSENDENIMMKIMTIYNRPKLRGFCNHNRNFNIRLRKFNSVFDVIDCWFVEPR